MLVINEICSRNAPIVQKDTNNKAEDYIELYNTSDEDLALDGWFLSVNTDNLVHTARNFRVLPQKSVSQQLIRRILPI